MDRTANAIARRIIRFTRRTWNPAQLALWASHTPATEAAYTEADHARFVMCLAAVKAGLDTDALRRALRAAEVKG